MTFDPQSIKAVVFDYGNTLIEFAASQIEHNDRALCTALEYHFGPVDFEKLKQIRDADRRAPYTDGFVENDLPTITAAMVKKLYGREAGDEHLNALLDVRFEAFVESITAPDSSLGLLKRLRETGRFKIGLLSNYPCGRAIRASLDRVGIAGLLDAVVVSGDVGHVKPHPSVYEAVLSKLDVAPAEAIYVGDNWLADVQGAKRAGMWAVHTLEYDTPEKFDREDDHVDADHVIHRLDELADWLAI